MSALRYLGDYQGGGANSISFTDIFDDGFDIFQINLYEYINPNYSGQLYTRLINSTGSIITSANYDYGHRSMTSYGAFGNANTTGDTSFLGFGYSQSENENTSTGVFTVFNPLSSAHFTEIILANQQKVLGFGSANKRGTCCLTTTAVVKGINFFGTSPHNINSIKFKVYGLRVE